MWLKKQKRCSFLNVMEMVILLLCCQGLKHSASLKIILKLPTCIYTDVFMFFHVGAGSVNFGTMKLRLLNLMLKTSAP